MSLSVSTIKFDSDCSLHGVTHTSLGGLRGFAAQQDVSPRSVIMPVSANLFSPPFFHDGNKSNAPFLAAISVALCLRTTAVRAISMLDHMPLWRLQVGCLGELRPRCLLTAMPAACCPPPLRRLSSGQPATSARPTDCRLAGLVYSVCT